MSTSKIGNTFTVEIHSVHSESIQQGTMTMVLFASVSLISTIVMPMVISTSSLHPTTSVYKTPPATSEVAFKDSLDDSEFAPPSKFKLRFSNPTIHGTWAASNVLASIALFSTAFACSSSIVMIQVSLLGISWAMSQWAPLALISTEISLHKSSVPYNQLQDVTDKMDSSPCSSMERGFSETSADVDSASEGLPAGIVMSIYNISIAAPQILAAILSSCMFWVLGRMGVDSSSAVGWVIGLGGLANLVAAWVAYREMDELSPGDTH